MELVDQAWNGTKKGTRSTRRRVARTYYGREERTSAMHMHACVCMCGCLTERLPVKAHVMQQRASENEHPSSTLRIHASPRDTIIVSWNTLLAARPACS